MRIEREIAVELRDGITIYTDVFRPVGDEPAPALIAWSAYGKQEIREQRLAPGEIVRVEIEVLQSSTLLAEGERLRLLVAATDIRPHGMEHGQTRNAGRHVLHTGGTYDAHLLVPVIP